MNDFVILWGCGVYLMIQPHGFQKLVGIFLGLLTPTNLMLFLSGMGDASRAPILEEGIAHEMYADPVPQIFILTAIVIGLGMLVLAFVITVRYREHFKTLVMKVVP
jgi:multicomponent Na+:H+ antiporter subunit C